MLKWERMPKIEKKAIPRELFEEVASHLDKPEITLITGSRQVGKTVLLEQLKNYLVKEKKIPESLIFSYNLDLVQDWEIFQNQADFIEFVKDRSQTQKVYILVDEAQKVPEAARFFKGVYDSKLNAKLVLTGSASLEIKAKFKETLAGRKRIFQLPPFTFSEFLSCTDKFLANALKEGRKINQIDRRKLVRLYKDYLTFGGYPRVVLSRNKEEKRNILKDIYSSYVEQDAIGFLEIKNKTAFNRLIRLLAAQTGQLINIEELATNLGIDRQTVERYLWALEQTFVVKKISPYFRNPRQEIIKAGKVYFLDSGIRNLVLENFDPLDKRIDKGSVLENAVLAELLFLRRNKTGEIHFWRTKQKAEVDFVIEKGWELLPIEVKYSVKKNRITSGLKSFVEKFNPRKVLVVNLTRGEGKVIVSKTRLDFVYPFEVSKIVE